MLLCWLTKTVSFSTHLESVVSASRLILTGINIFSDIYGKDYSSPSVFFIILSLDWCFFANILKVPQPKSVWRYLYGIFIFLLVMEDNQAKILLDMSLGLAEDLINSLVEDGDAVKDKTYSGRCCMIQMDLMAELRGCWRYILSMEAMGKVSIHRMQVRRCFLAYQQGIRHSWNQMERKTKSKIFTMTMIQKFWYHNVDISEQLSEASSFIMWCAIWSFSQKMLSTHVIRIRARSSMKEDNGFNNPLANKAYLWEASSIHFILYIFLTI